MIGFVLADPLAKVYSHFSAMADFAPLESTRTRPDGSRPADQDIVTAIGQVLVDENYKGVNYRYNETDQAHAFEYHYKYQNGSCLQAVEVLALCDCYEYQAAEDPSYLESKAEGLVQWIRLNAIGRLPGYKDAPWGVYT
jgi:hypothetical protein